MPKEIQQPTTAEESAAIERRAAGDQRAPLSPKYGGPCVSRRNDEDESREVDPKPEGAA